MGRRDDLDADEYRVSQLKYRQEVVVAGTHSDFSVIAISAKELRKLRPISPAASGGRSGGVRELACPDDLPRRVSIAPAEITSNREKQPAGILSAASAGWRITAPQGIPPGNRESRGCLLTAEPIRGGRHGFR
jgi:hypothetical protein